MLIVEDLYTPNKEKEAQNVYGTVDRLHPAVEYLFTTAGKFIASPPPSLHLTLHRRREHRRPRRRTAAPDPLRLQRDALHSPRVSQALPEGELPSFFLNRKNTSQYYVRELYLIVS